MSQCLRVIVVTHQLSVKQSYVKYSEIMQCGGLQADVVKKCDKVALGRPLVVCPSGIGKQ